MTPTTVGWILADGDDVDGATLAGEEFTVQPGCGGVGAVNASEQAAAAVLRVQTMVEAQGERLHGIGVTWRADAAAEGALLLESLTDAGFDNVVPVRFHQAAGSLTHGDRPEQTELSLPAVVEADAQLAVAHGAALALEPGAEFSNLCIVPQRDELPAAESVAHGARSLSYAGALTMLVAGAVTFVVSLSITLSMQLTPAKEPTPVHPVAKASERPPAAQPVVPVGRPVPPPAGIPEPPAEAPHAPGPAVDNGVVDDGAAAPSEELPAPRE